MIDKILTNIREALEGPKNEVTDSYVKLQVLLAQRERDKLKAQYGAANLGRRKDDNNDKWKGVF